MNRKICILVAAALLTLASPALAAPMVMAMGVAEQMDEQAPVINVDGNEVSIAGGSGMTLEVVSLTGRAVASYKIEGPNQSFKLSLPKGCYILKVGKTVRKVTIR